MPFEKIESPQAIILTTGRISSEIIYKVWNMGIPVIISHSAPTANAVTLARKGNMALIGYVRKGKMNIYSQERRVMIDDERNLSENIRQGDKVADSFLVIEKTWLFRKKALRT